MVIPVFNEEENLPLLIEELSGVLVSLQRPYEIICVDDCSRDRSAGVLEELRARFPRLRPVRHRVNCGQSAALATGFELAQGDIVVTLDADMQNDPADIPMLLGALAPGVAAVCGVRRKRRDSWAKRLSSRIANRFRNALTGARVTDAGCTLRAIRRSALAEMPVFNGMHRFLSTILLYQGCRVLERDVNHRPRLKGKSKYGIRNRLWRGIVDCVAMRWFRDRCLRGDRCEGEDRPA